MLVTGLRAEGIRDVEMIREPGRRVDLPSGSVGRAMADALVLWAGSLCGDQLARALVAVGAASSEDAVELVVEEGAVVGASWDRVGAMASMLEAGERRFGVEVSLDLDPLLFASLREQAVRDPRLVSALGQRLTMKVKVGWLLTRDGLGCTIGVLALSVGGVEFPVSGSEKAAWATSILRDVGRRVARVRWSDSASQVATRISEAARCTDPQRRQAAERASNALSSAPFRFGRLEPIESGVELEVALGPDLLRIERFGPAGLHALQLVEEVFMEQPDVLIVDGPGAGFSRPGAIARWLAARVDGTDATLEQVWFVSGGAR